MPIPNCNPNNEAVYTLYFDGDFLAARATSVLYSRLLDTLSLTRSFVK